VRARPYPDSAGRTPAGPGTVSVERAAVSRQACGRRQREREEGGRPGGPPAPKSPQLARGRAVAQYDVSCCHDPDTTPVAVVVSESLVQLLMTVWL